MHATRGSGTRAGSLTTPTVLLVLVVVGCQVAVMADVFLVDIPNTKLVVGLPLSSAKRANPDVLLPLLRDHAWLLEASDSAPVVAPVNEETNDAKPEAPQEETTTAAPTRPPTRPPVDGSHPLAKAALVVLCYNRPQLLQDAIDHLRQADDFDTIKKYISQDGSERQTREVAQGYRSTFEYLTHPRTLPARIKLNTTDPDRQVKDTPGTMYLTAHYKWVLDKLLIEKNHSHAIIVEDDLMVSVDFIRMFAATVPLLDADPSLWCVSSWNDNGFPDFDLPKGAFFRSSFFPGLGWMLKRDTWLELSPKFPDDNWDHWMRVSTTHRGRSCLVPFLSRNRNAGETGATSNTDFYETYLKRVVTLNKEAATPRPKFITAELLEADYDKELSKALGAAQVISQAEVYLSPTLFQSGKSYLVPYRSSEFGQSLSQSLHIHPTPRTQYKGVTWLQYNKAHLFLVDMRLSELAPFSLRELADSSLHAVRARAPNVNCITACQQFGASVREEGWTCDENQFDYINDCQVLASQFDGCPTGCTQGWGEDIPNMETWEVGTDRPQCLVTEMTPTCAASHRLTTRLCPCVKRSEGNPPMPVVPADKLSFVGTRRVGENCFEACADYRRSPEMNPTHRCDDRQMTFANSCSSLKQRFGCLTCERSANAKAAPSASEDKTVCYLPVLHAGDCARFDAAEWRLCSCVPI